MYVCVRIRPSETDVLFKGKEGLQTAGFGTSMELFRQF